MQLCDALDNLFSSERFQVIRTSWGHIVEFPIENDRNLCLCRLFIEDSDEHNMHVSLISGTINGTTELNHGPLPKEILTKIHLIKTYNKKINEFLMWADKTYVL